MRAGSVSLGGCTIAGNSAIGGLGGIGSPGTESTRGQNGQGKGGAIFVNAGASVYEAGPNLFQNNAAANDTNTPTDNDNIYGTTSFITDCNCNNINDAQDISGGESGDCNTNGVPDECENGADCDTDGVPDLCEPDSDADGTPDDCDGCPNDANKIEPGFCGCGVSEADSDSDGVLDCKDVCPGSDDTLDCDTDGIPDGCESDCDSNGVPDDCEVDCNSNGMADVCEVFDDCNTNGVPDACEPDSDSDGVIDDCDACAGQDDHLDTDNDGIPDCADVCPTAGDSDGDGVEDCQDKCPSDPNKIEPGECGCGVADTDSDDDGVADCNDVCPNNAAGAAVDGEGRPIGDDNGDCVVNLKDAPPAPGEFVGTPIPPCATGLMGSLSASVALLASARSVRTRRGRRASSMRR
ncbi:hypothetical protein B7486_01575 [cyanobacterium TDX16]|nr:hypothetical protein B7486_01575 [cyanobacterium TDX16]